MKLCNVDACDKPAVKHKVMCGMHVSRVYRYGSPHVERPRGHRQKVNTPAYSTVHRRLTKERGVAAANPCIACGTQAAEWAYQGGCPSELNSKYGPYSADQSLYEPMCVMCHKAFDRQARSLQRSELWEYEARCQPEVTNESVETNQMYQLT